MKYVRIYKLENDGKQRVVITCKLIGDSVVCEGESTAIIEGINKNGIKNYENDEKLFPADGEVFLKQLKFNFKSGYLNASDVLES